MHYRKIIKEQLLMSGVRLGDSCSIFPSTGKKKAFTLNRYCIDFISSRYRPHDLSLAYIELPHFGPQHFHYRLELDDKKEERGRFVLKTILGEPFWLNGLAAKEAYVERSDKLYIDDHKLNFDSRNLKQLSSDHFEHPVLELQHLLQSDLKILLIGESGTGKTHLAQKIHERSGRRGSFVSVNLSSFNSSLIESELFGHKKGSFTGALNDKIGALALAENGTLFLDEVDSLPLEIQTKLLTFLDSKKYRRVGDTRENEVKCRLIFASGRSLEELVKREIIRKDFYYRLASGHITQLTSLRNEIKKIEEACRFYALANGISFSEQLIEFYKSLAWPGNLRQLFGHLNKKKILSKGTKIDFDSVDQELLLQSSDLMSIGEESCFATMQELKIKHANRALGICDGNFAMAARKLRVNERTVKSLITQGQLARM